MTLTFPSAGAHLVDGLRVAVGSSPRSSAIESGAFTEMRSVGGRRAVREKHLQGDDNSRLIVCFLQNRQMIR